MDKYIEDILIEYVTEQHFANNAEIVIRDFCSIQRPLSITVYRGHTKTPVMKQRLWYSASTDINIAANEFAGIECCIFKIHLLDIPCIDINKYIGDKIGDKKDENEIIFLGGGTYYKNSDLTEEGYVELKTNALNKRTFECWYSLSKLQTPQPQPLINSKNNVEHALKIIDPDEYEFIDSIDDIIINDNIMLLSNEEKQQILEEILKRKAIGGNVTRKHSTFGGNNKYIRKTKKYRKMKNKNKKSKKRHRRFKMS